MSDDLKAKLREGADLLLKQMKYADTEGGAAARDDLKAFADAVAALSGAVAALREPANTERSES